MPRKAGANRLDQATIKKLAVDEGKKATEISQVLNIELDVVKSFMPKKTAKPAATSKE